MHFTFFTKYLKQCLLLWMLLFATQQSAFAQGWVAPKTGKVPDAITGFELVNGTPVVLSNYQGNVTVIYFDGDWCPPCVATGKPHLLTMIEKYKGKNVKFLYMNNDPNVLREKRVKEAEQLGIDIAMPTLALCPIESCRSRIKTTTGAVGPYGNIYWYPSIHMLDKSGKVVEKIESPSEIVRDLSKYIDKYLEAQP
jgi:thiol-disulfide isomerase/thioredoxin